MLAPSIKPVATAKTSAALPELRSHAAGIDIGATEIYVAVPHDAHPQPVRAFGTFTPDLCALADWLTACSICTVAMESTGVYWIPLFQLLEARGFEVCLVNARHVKNVPGRKSDVSDCQWLQYLHAVGLLRGSFRPVGEVCAVRSLLRHRGALVQSAAAHVQHMQKALTQMNLQLHHVISDITGKTGLAILSAILAGDRDPEALADLRDRRIKAPKEAILKALQGDYRSEHLFTLRQSLSSWRHYQELIAQCDLEILRCLDKMEDRDANSSGSPIVGPDPSVSVPAQEGSLQGSTPSGPTEGPIRASVEPSACRSLDLRTELERILGVDLTQVPGLHVASVYTIFSEIGRDLSAFPTAKHFASWLGLCPDNRISGGKVLSVRTRRVKNRAATVLRIAAQALYRSTSALGDYYRRMRAKLGAPAAITAAAHKLARIIYHLLTTRESYDETVFARNDAQVQQRRVKHLQREAAALGLTLQPASEPSVS